MVSLKKNLTEPFKIPLTNLLPVMGSLGKHKLPSLLCLLL